MGVGVCLVLTLPVVGLPEKPNFLLIMTDDQRWDALGVVQREMANNMDRAGGARFPWFETPNLDRLAQGGLRFRNAFVTSSICSPSRAVFLTGRYNHANGIVNNHTPMPAEMPTFATILQKHGYRTGYIGKWHMGHQRKRPGFDHVFSFVGQGSYWDEPFLKNGQKVTTDGWVDDVSTQRAIAFMRRNQDQPFVCYLGYKAPHGPRSKPPKRTRHKYSQVKLRQAVNRYAVPPAHAPHHAPRVPNTAKREDRRNYFRILRAIDDNVGKLMRAIERLELTRRTVMVFTSDNGYLLGEHGLRDKRLAYEASIRIPMLLRYPPMTSEGGVRDELVLNADIAPTFLDLAGVEVPQRMHGRSLRPVLAGEATGWRDAFLYEYFAEQNLGPPSVVALRTNDAKWVRYPGNPRMQELFDLALDPYETRNFSQHRRYRSMRQRLDNRLRRKLDQLDFRVPTEADERAREQLAELSQNGRDKDGSKTGEGPKNQDRARGGNGRRLVEYRWQGKTPAAQREPTHNADGVAGSVMEETGDVDGRSGLVNFKAAWLMIKRNALDNDLADGENSLSFTVRAKGSNQRIRLESLKLTMGSVDSSSPRWRWRVFVNGRGVHSQPYTPAKALSKQTLNMALDDLSPQSEHRIRIEFANEKPGGLNHTLRLQRLQVKGQFKTDNGS
jgi:arylsulfatase A-like enzyme